MTTKKEEPTSKGQLFLSASFDKSQAVPDSFAKGDAFTPMILLYALQ
jgi:hypothetical protein